MHLRWKDIEYYVHEAVTRFLNNKRDLPIKFITSHLEMSGDDKYVAYFEDTKITDFYKQIGKNLDGEFKIIITPDFYEDNATTSIDLAAKIPSNMPAEKKAILRIAYCILVSWQRCFIEAYSFVAPNKYAVTYANAKKWYDGLK